LPYPELWRGSSFDIQAQWNLTPIKVFVRHITVHPHRKRSATIRRVNCAGIPSGLTTSSDAPVSDWLRMRQAIVRPLNSMLPDFKALYSNSALPRLPQFEGTVGSSANKALSEPPRVWPAKVIGKGSWSGSPDLIALRSSAFGQTAVQVLSGSFSISCDSVEYYCDAYAIEPTVDQSSIVVL
jgi:hypothetical protein